MSHPFQSVRQGKVEHSRVSKITEGYAKGGHADVKADKSLIKSMVKPGAMKMDGAMSKGRLDKHARGGAVGKSLSSREVRRSVRGVSNQWVR